MATTLKKQFLDYAGLEQFWGIINGKFANKTDAVKVESFGFDTTDASVTMTYKDSTTAGKSYGIAIPMATKDDAGMLSASDKALIDDIDNKINAMAPFHGLRIEGKEINLPGKRGNIGLRFDTAGKVEDGTRTAFIELVDLGYPADAEGNPYSWSEIAAEVYEANASNKAYYAYEGKYYKWSQDGVEGPKNNVGEPLMSQPLSRIDVTELVKAGLLQDADVVLKDGKMQLQLVFITNAAGNETKTVYVDVTDLVDVYTEGEGIEITNSSLSADGKQKEGTIKLRVANYGGNNELGGIRVGYTSDDVKQLYKVQLDATGNAYVAVPWEHTSVNVASNDTNSAGENYLVVATNHDLNKVDANGIPTPAYNFTVEVGAGVKNAEALAGTSVQSVAVGSVSETDASVSKDAYIKVATAQKTRTVEVNGETKTINAGTEVTAELTDSAKASLGLADTAVQDVKTSTIERGDATHTPTGEDLVVSLVDADNANNAYVDGKGKKAIKVTLGSKTTTSLDKADTALQTVSIMGTQLSIDSDKYTTAQASQALELGTAANVNTVAVMPDFEATEANKAQFQSKVLNSEGVEELRDNVATTYAVKKYVDDENTAQSQTLRNWVTNDVIANLDGEVSVSAAAAQHADYTAAYGADVTPQQVMVGVKQVDGVITEATPHILSVTDIADFAPLSATDINTICGIQA